MDIFTRFKTAIKIRDVLVDNNVFQLHYRVTAILLLCCAGLVASKQHFGDPIDCITKDDVPNDLMDTYCWIHSTFTLPNACNKTVGVEVAHPCVDKSSNPFAYEERVYHKYYQWVYFVLFFQAAFFYAPHFFWKSYESRLLRTLISDLRDPLFRKEEKVGHANQVVTYLERRSSQHQRYYYLFIIFEICNLINVLAQMYIVDQFLGGFFTSYGLDVLEYAQMEQTDRLDPMVRIFPRMTKCTFHRFGASGDLQRYDAMCILPLNIINEKIYIVMWFWFVFLAFVTSAWLVYRALTFIMPQLRFEMLRRRANLTDERKLERVLERTETGDWFLLCMMCKNMDAQWFRYIVDQLDGRLKMKTKNGANNTTASKQRRSSARRDGKEPILLPNGSLNDEDDDLSLDDYSSSDELSDLERGERNVPKESNNNNNDSSNNKTAPV